MRVQAASVGGALTVVVEMMPNELSAMPNEMVPLRSVQGGIVPPCVDACQAWALQVPGRWLREAHAGL